MKASLCCLSRFKTNHQSYKPDKVRTVLWYSTHTMYTTSIERLLMLFDEKSQRKEWPTDYRRVKCTGMYQNSEPSNWLLITYQTKNMKKALRHKNYDRLEKIYHSMAAWQQGTSFVEYIETDKKLYSQFSILSTPVLETEAQRSPQRNGVWIQEKLHC